MEFELLQKELIKKVKRLKGDTSLYIRFLRNTKTIAHNSTKEFWAASLIKLPVVISLFDLLAEEKLALDQIIDIADVNIVKGSGIIHLLSQRQFDLVDLITLTLTLSDNTAANQLIDIAGMPEINQKLKDLGLTSTVLKHKLMIEAGQGPNITTAQEMGTIFELLFTNKLAASNKILELLNEEKRRDGIPTLLPNELFLPHKTGNLTNGFHDAGIVYAKNPFIFCFLSDDLENKIKDKQLVSELAEQCFTYASN